MKTSKRTTTPTVLGLNADGALGLSLSCAPEETPKLEVRAQEYLNVD